MSEVVITSVIDTDNHLQNQYLAKKKFVRFPQDQKNYTFVNGTAVERTIASGTLVGITTADVTIAQPVESDVTDGSQKPLGIVLYDIVIPAGVTEEVSGLVGLDGSIYEGEVVLEKTGDTLDTVITEEGQSIRMALRSYNNDISLVDSAVDQSDYINSQV